MVDGSKPNWDTYAILGIYKRLITLQEILASYNNGCPGNPSNRTDLVLWAPLDEGQGNTVTDKSGYTATGTFTGSNLTWRAVTQNASCAQPDRLVLCSESFTLAGGAYRYGFNGKEKDDKGEFGNAHYDYGFRIYNPSIAKFLSVDPLTKSYPWYTPYQFAGNNPIRFIDLDGAEPTDPMGMSMQYYYIYNTAEKNGESGFDAAKRQTKLDGATAILSSAIAADIILNKGRITILTAKDILVQISANTLRQSIQNGGDWQAALTIAFNDVDLANSVIKGVFEGTNLSKMPYAKVAEETLKAAIDFRIGEGKLRTKINEEEFDDFVAETVIRLVMLKVPKSKSNNKQVKESINFIIDVVKTATRGEMMDVYQDKSKEEQRQFEKINPEELKRYMVPADATKVAPTIKKRY